MAIKLKVQENKVSFRVSDNNSATFKAEQGRPIYPDSYQGDYTVTPSTEAQTLQTNGLMMADDVEVEAVPSAGQLDAYAYANVEDEECWQIYDNGRVVVNYRDERHGYLNAERSGWVETQGEFGAIPNSVLNIEFRAEQQLPTQEALTITPTESSQTAVPSGKYTTGAITVNAIPSNYVGSGITRRSSSDLTESKGTVTVPSGYYGSQATKQVPLVPYAIRPDAELIESYTFDQYAVADLGLTIPAYTTTAQNLKTSTNLSPTVSVDLTNYRYIIAERFLTIPEYSVTTKGKGRQEYTWCSYIYEITRANANEFATIIDPTKKITSVQNLISTNTLFRLLYWSSSSAIALYSSNGYGAYQTPTTPSVSDTTLTVKSPTLAVRGSTTYFTSTYMNALTDIRYQYVIDVYRAPMNNLNVDGWEQDQTVQHIIDCVNTSGHDLT